VTDLLRRDCAVGEASPAMRYLSGERVLITGGGGSIGSELARQVAALAPASLIILGKGENSIFEIHQELRDANVQGCLPVVCDVRDVQALEQVFRQHTPTVVIHAAAHKHVPLMEDVPIEAIRNNVFGTLNLAEVAIRHGVQRFILVSTDKAVKPENVMGATKRVAEMTVSALAGRSETAFATVRFGNVLGSRGSLVPILRRQILAGGPVTLTHPEMTRFFMTIPEAVELILQAGAMGEKGEIFILDMGEPISIVQLATDMIRLHGLVPGEDIEIKYTGIRPGEKLHEELAAENEALLPSQNERISVVRPSVAADWHWLGQQLEDLKQLCDSGDVLAARAALMELAWGKTLPPVPPSGEAPVPGRFADRQ
jgi:FlaA1/EpsC-like NDP-sugar epimerase